MARKRKGVAVRTRRLAVCALFCAVGVVLLGLGAITEILDLTAAMLVSLLLIPIVVEYGYRSPWLDHHAPKLGNANVRRLSRLLSNPQEFH